MGLGHCALKKFLAEAKVCASNPDAHSNRPKARLKLSSSSTIPMMHLLAGVFGSCTAPYYRKLPVTRHCIRPLRKAQDSLSHLFTVQSEA
jgi:hypothetical protein